jgi:hypothetical protein
MITIPISSIRKVPSIIVLISDLSVLKESIRIGLEKKKIQIIQKQQHNLELKRIQQKKRFDEYVLRV